MKKKVIAISSIIVLVLFAIALIGANISAPDDAPTKGFVAIPPDVWTLVFTWGNLLILFLLMKKFLFGPVKKIIDERQAEVSEMYSEADKDKSDAAALKAEYESRLESARNDADEIVKTASRNAQLKGEKIIADAHSEANVIIKRAEERIEAEKKNAENEIKNDISDIAISIASKVIEEDISAQKHKKLIDKFIDGLGDTK